ncbi:MAG: hypothetical protein E6713_08555 [Sporomusaceae bacterium]|nr:hypothetical protein [Sporomusaceae bacterium]
MKRIILVLMMILMAYTTVFAAGGAQAELDKRDAKKTDKPVVVEPATHFANIDVQGETKFYFDTNTIRYTKDPYRDELLIDVWIKTPLKQGFTLNRYLLRMQEREYMLTSGLIYANETKLLSQEKYAYQPERWSPVIPGSPQSIWYQSIINYASQNDKQLKKDFEKKRGEL